MKLHYERVWDAEINDDDIIKECQPYLTINYSRFTHKEKDKLIYTIAKSITRKYTSYYIEKLPNAFLRPLYIKINQYLINAYITSALDD